MRLSQLLGVGMFFSWLAEIVRRVVTPAKGLGELLQLVAALAIAGASIFFGVIIPEGTGDRLLAYGLAAIGALLALRLVWAPYSMWNEQRVKIGQMQAEMENSERLVQAHLAKHHARARRKYVANVHRMVVSAHGRTEAKKSRIVKAMAKANHSVVAGALPLNLLPILARFYFACLAFDSRDEGGIEVSSVGESLIQHANGAISFEVLCERLPSSILKYVEPIDLAEVDAPETVEMS